MLAADSAPPTALLQDPASSARRVSRDAADNAHPGTGAADSPYDSDAVALRPRPRALRILSRALDFAKAQWFQIGLGVFIALAHSYPNFARSGGLIRGEYTIGYGAVAVIFLMLGLGTDTRELLQNIRHWRAHFTVGTLLFLITPAIVYGIACGIKAANNPNMDDWMLAGLIVTATCPTTVALNVVMTRQADGNVVLTLCEVFIGNLLGAFILPALVQMFLTGAWDFANPAADLLVRQLYADVMKQLGLLVFVPLFVGQVVRSLFKEKVVWTLKKLKLNKLGSIMLLLIMFLLFSTAFYQKAFTLVPSALVIFMVFFNIGIYLFFTVLCYLYARPYPLLLVFKDKPSETSLWAYRWLYRAFRGFYYDRRDTVLVMLCGAAKTAALGVLLVQLQYGEDLPHLGQLLVPLVLYQSEQVITALILTRFMKKWVQHGPDRWEISTEEEVEDNSSKHAT